MNNNVSFKKNVAVLHSSSTGYLLDKKLFDCLSHYALKKMSSDEVHIIPLSQLKKKIGFHSKNISAIKKSLVRLCTTPVELDLLGQFGGYLEKRKMDLALSEWTVMTLLSEASLDSGVVSYEFSTTMRKLLWEPALYETVNLNVVKSFNSRYAYGLYELALRARKITSTGWIENTIFRRLMGIPMKSYERFCDLNKKVIQVAEKELERLYDEKIVHVNAVIKSRKVGGKYTHFAIEVIDYREPEKNFKQPSPKEIDKYTPVEKGLLIKLNKTYGLSINQSEGFLKKLGPAETNNVLDKIDGEMTNLSFDKEKIGGFTFSRFQQAMKLKAISDSLKDGPAQVKVTEDLDSILNGLNDELWEMVENDVSRLCKTYQLVQFHAFGVKSANARPFLKQVIYSNRKEFSYLK